jgi:hypothetical protein
LHPTRQGSSPGCDTNAYDLSSVIHVLVGEDRNVVGRFNLYDLVDGTAVGFVATGLAEVGRRQDSC